LPHIPLISAITGDTRFTSQRYYSSSSQLNVQLPDMESATAPRIDPPRPKMFKIPSRTALLAPAFRLVFDILQKEPHHFQTLLKQGLSIQQARVQAETPIASSSSSETANDIVSRRKKSRGVMLRKEKEEVKDLNLNRLPENHPFVSARSACIRPSTGVRLI
jgi:hypothetical protein